MTILLLQTETALLYDAVHLFAKALDELSRAQEVKVHPMSCNKAKEWEHGNSLLNYLKMVSPFFLSPLITQLFTPVQSLPKIGAQSRS